VTEPAHVPREIAESFGSDADRYDRSRPSYPQAMVDRIVAASPGPDVLDAGCGTGIAARQFQAAGCRVLGVDADARMAGLARQHGIEAEVARVEDWDPAGRAFDAVVCGQAWHWIDMAAGAAKAAQALRPGGLLAVFWNAMEPPPSLAEAFGTVLRRVLPDRPVPSGGTPGGDAYATLCSKAGDAAREVGGFGEPEQWRFDWDRPYTRDEWLDQVPTFGGIGARLPPAQLQELLAGVAAAIDAVGGTFTMHYATVALIAPRTPAP
jgi:SAM-dependent methyltransferase